MVRFGRSNPFSEQFEDQHRCLVEYVTNCFDKEGQIIWVADKGHGNRPLRREQ